MAILRGTPSLKIVVLVHMALCMFLGVATSLSAEEYLEMKRRLKTLNRPAVKSIQTGYGDIFNCVDIYKQPAFDHPLLKNYKIPEVPKLPFPEGHNALISSNETVDFELPDGGCPDGTVPIRRVQMQDLLRARSVSGFGKKYVGNISFPSTGQSVDKYHWAMIDTRSGDFHGTYVDINIWKPNVIGNDKYSSAQLWLVNGPPDQLNVIEAGWTVCGELFGDQEPRFFIYWTSDRYQKTGCFNTLCPGFVSVNQNAPLGRRFSQTSTPGGDQYFVKVLVAQEKQDWWLYINNKVVGFWPARLFNHMNQKAEKVMWGGEVYSEQGTDFPPMGSGYRSEKRWEKACFIKKIEVVNERNERSDGPLDVSVFVDKKCYSLTDEGMDDDPNWGRSIYFGGPGGQC